MKHWCMLIQSEPFAFVVNHKCMSPNTSAFMVEYIISMVNLPKWDHIKGQRDWMLTSWLRELTWMSSLSSTVLSMLNMAGGRRWAGGSPLSAIVMMLLRFTLNTHTHGCFCCTNQQTEREMWSRNTEKLDTAWGWNALRLLTDLQSGWVEAVVA